MSLFGEDRPRSHHYLFAHRVLPSSLPAIAANALRLVAEQAVDEVLRRVWNDVGESLPEAERLPSDGLGATLEAVGDADVLLVTMPRAEHATEAHFAAIVLSDPPRYFVLEHSWSTDDEPITVLGGWEPGRHVNYGDGPPPGKAAFLAAVAGRL